MTKTAPTMKIHRDGIEPTIKGDMLASQQAMDQRNADLREAAAKGVQSVLARRAADAAPEEAADPVQFPQEPRENVESVVLQMPNGKEVEYGPRKASTIIAMANIFGNTQPNTSTLQVVTTLMWVRKIDGDDIAMPANMVDIQKLANELTDEGVDILMMARMKFWPGVSRDDLPVLKKNLRDAGL